MTTDENPYRPPTAELGEAPTSEPTTDFQPDGDLARALAGEAKLYTMDVLREAWTRIYGHKRSTAGVLFLFLMVYAVALVAATAGSYAIAGQDPGILLDPTQNVIVSAELATSPSYLVAANLLMAPLNALLYLGVWNVGIRLARGQQTRFRDTLPVQRLLPGILVMLCHAPLSLLVLLHPFAGYLGLPAWMLTMWAFPLMLDRNLGAIEAIVTSIRLTVRNIPAVLAIGLTLAVGYIITTVTCCIGAIWFLPFAAATLGVAWRQVAGIKAIPSA